MHPPSPPPRIGGYPADEIVVEREYSPGQYIPNFARDFGRMWEISYFFYSTSRQTSKGSLARRILAATPQFLILSDGNRLKRLLRLEEIHHAVLQDSAPAEGENILFCTTSPASEPTVWLISQDRDPQNFITGREVLRIVSFLLHKLTGQWLRVVSLPAGMDIRSLPREVVGDFKKGPGYLDAKQKFDTLQRTQRTRGGGGGGAGGGGIPPSAARTVFPEEADLLPERVFVVTFPEPIGKAPEGLGVNVVHNAGVLYATFVEPGGPCGAAGVPPCVIRSYGGYPVGSTSEIVALNSQRAAQGVATVELAVRPLRDGFSFTPRGGQTHPTQRDPRLGYNLYFPDVTDTLGIGGVLPNGGGGGGPSAGGLRVTTILPDGVLSRAGVPPGVIVAFDGEAVTSEGDLIRLNNKRISEMRREATVHVLPEDEPVVRLDELFGIESGAPAATGGGGGGDSATATLPANPSDPRWLSPEERKAALAPASEARGIELFFPNIEDRLGIAYQAYPDGDLYITEVDPSGVCGAAGVPEGLIMSFEGQVCGSEGQLHSLNQARIAEGRRRGEIVVRPTSAASAGHAVVENPARSEPTPDSEAGRRHGLSVLDPEDFPIRFGKKTGLSGGGRSPPEAHSTPDSPVGNPGGAKPRPSLMGNVKIAGKGSMRQKKRGGAGGGSARIPPEYLEAFLPSFSDKSLEYFHEVLLYEGCATPPRLCVAVLTPASLYLCDASGATLRCIPRECLHSAYDFNEQNKLALRLNTLDYDVLMLNVDRTAFLDTLSQTGHPPVHSALLSELLVDTGGPHVPPPAIRLKPPHLRRASGGGGGGGGIVPPHNPQGHYGSTTATSATSPGGVVSVGRGERVLPYVPLQSGSPRRGGGGLSYADAECLAEASGIAAVEVTPPRGMELSRSHSRGGKLSPPPPEWPGGVGGQHPPRDHHHRLLLRPASPSSPNDSPRLLGSPGVSLIRPVSPGTGEAGRAEPSASFWGRGGRGAAASSSISSSNASPPPRLRRRRSRRSSVSSASSSSASPSSVGSLGPESPVAVTRRESRRHQGKGKEKEKEKARRQRRGCREPTPPRRRRRRSPSEGSDGSEPPFRRQGQQQQQQQQVGASQRRQQQHTPSSSQGGGGGGGGGGHSHSTRSGGVSRGGGLPKGREEVVHVHQHVHVHPALAGGGVAGVVPPPSQAQGVAGHRREGVVVLPQHRGAAPQQHLSPHFEERPCGGEAEWGRSGSGSGSNVSSSSSIIGGSPLPPPPEWRAGVQQQQQLQHHPAPPGPTPAARLAALEREVEAIKGAGGGHPPAPLPSTPSPPPPPSTPLRRRAEGNPAPAASSASASSLSEPGPSEMRQKEQQRLQLEEGLQARRRRMLQQQQQEEEEEAQMLHQRRRKEEEQQQLELEELQARRRRMQQQQEEEAAAAEEEARQRRERELLRREEEQEAAAAEKRRLRRLQEEEEAEAQMLQQRRRKEQQQLEEEAEAERELQARRRRRQQQEEEEAEALRRRRALEQQREEAEASAARLRRMEEVFQREEGERRARVMRADAERVEEAEQARQKRAQREELRLLEQQQRPAGGPRRAFDRQRFAKHLEDEVAKVLQDERAKESERVAAMRRRLDIIAATPPSPLAGPPAAPGEGGGPGVQRFLAALVEQPLPQVLAMYPGFRADFNGCAHQRREAVALAWRQRDKDPWLFAKLERCYGSGSFDEVSPPSPEEPHAQAVELDEQGGGPYTPQRIVAEELLYPDDAVQSRHMSPQYPKVKRRQPLQERVNDLSNYATPYGVTQGDGVVLRAPPSQQAGGGWGAAVPPKAVYHPVPSMRFGERSLSQQSSKRSNASRGSVQHTRRWQA